MSTPHVLIVEDDEDIVQLVSFNLLKAGYNVSSASSVEDGWAKVKAGRIDAVLLDLMLPGQSGMDLCERIRRDDESAHIPILMMTARRQEEEIVAGLEAGADDYITKPFSPKVLLARLQAVLRRTAPVEEGKTAEECLEAGPVRINLNRHLVQIGEREVRLTATEFALLVLLARRPGWVFSRRQIIDAVRGDGYLVTSRMIDVQVFSLRKKMGAAGSCIETVRGVGYRFGEGRAT